MIRLAIPSIENQEKLAVEKVLKSGFLVQGKTVMRFEEAVARFLKIRCAVAVNSGTSALHLALLALGLGPGDEVIVPDYTFPATANAVELTGARPVFVDIDPLTFNIDPQAVKGAVTARTRAIIPVHLFGQSSDMAPILRLAQQYGLTVIEDAACVMGAEYKGAGSGTIGQMGCFSFHPRKIITTAEGGMIVTRSRDMADRLKVLRNHGMTHKNHQIDLVMPGFNYRMTEMQAAMGLVQLKKLPALIQARRKAAALYDACLQEIEWIKTPSTPSYNTHVFQSYIIQVPRTMGRDRLINHLRKNGIEANFGTYALHRLTFYKNKYRLKPGRFPVTEEAFETSIALPLFDRLGPSQIKKIAGVLKKFR